MYIKLACSFAGVNSNFTLIYHVTLDIKVSLSVVGVNSNFYFKSGLHFGGTPLSLEIIAGGVTLVGLLSVLKLLLGCHFGGSPLNL